ncbi:MAG: domain, repeat protein, partial [Verrucomicrobia bacterium]|nr:domain, repeat protein [Verrucomicrobiota bacterium]
MMSFLLLAKAGQIWAQVPTVTLFEPISGKVGETVQITGTGFTTAKSLTFNGVPAIFYTEGDTIIHTTIPEGALSGPIGVNNHIGAGASVASFSVAPFLTKLTPDRGLSGHTVVISGENLLNTTNVSFGEIEAVFTLISASQVSTVIPAGATNAPIKVMTTIGSTTSTNVFLVTGEPVIRSFTPTVASVGQSVTIDGGDFTGVTNVLFNGQPAASFALTALNQVQATIPATATTGLIKVQTPGGTATSTNNLITGAGPIVTGFSPSAGPSTKPVIISGTGFFNGGGAVTVKFNGVTVAATVTADNQIQTTVPASATTGPISVTRGTNTFITSSNFIVGAFPLITSVTPEVGFVGTRVVINGQNLNAVTKVRFGTVAATTVFHTADTQIQADVPAGATNALIYLENSTFTNSSPNIFIVNGTAPTIVNFQPVGGAPGSIVTLYGYNFANASAVRLNGQSVSYLVTATSGTNQIAVTLPTNATTGNFSVTSPSGTGNSTN